MARRIHLLQQPANLAVRDILDRLMGSTADAARRLGKADDKESLHDFRVSLRRLRSACKGYRAELPEVALKKLVKKLGKLTDATNAGRDAEVHARWLHDQLGRRQPRLVCMGMRLMLDTLESQPATSANHGRIWARQFTKLQRGLKSALNEQQVVPLTAIPQLTSLGEAAAKHLAVLREQLAHQAGELQNAAQQEVAHQTRLTAKRIRYLLEPLTSELAAARPAIVRLRKLQDLLGDLHDLHTLEVQVTTELDRAGASMAQEMARCARRDERLTQAVTPGSTLEACRALAALIHHVRQCQRRLYQQYLRQWAQGGMGRLDRRLQRIELRLAGQAARRSRPTGGATPSLPQAVI